MNFLASAQSKLIQNLSIFGCDSSPRSPNVRLSVCLSHLVQLTTGDYRWLQLTDFRRTSNRPLNDFVLYGLQNLLVYKSQPPGLRDLFLNRSLHFTKLSKVDQAETREESCSVDTTQESCVLDSRTWWRHWWLQNTDETQERRRPQLMDTAEEGSSFMDKTKERSSFMDKA